MHSQHGKVKDTEKSFMYPFPLKRFYSLHYAFLHKDPSNSDVHSLFALI